MMRANGTAQGAAAPAGRTLLERVNGAPAPTWNRLGMNAADLTVSAVAAPAEACGPAGDAAGGMGPAARAWLLRAAGEAGCVRRVEVGAGERPAEPVVVDLGELGAPAGAPPVCALDVAVGAGACARVVLVARPPADGGAARPQGAGDPPAPATCGWTVRLHAGAGSRVEVCTVVAAPGWQVLDDLGVEAQDGACVDVRAFYLEGVVAAAGLACDLAGDRSALAADVRYAGHGDGALDFNYAVRQVGRATVCDLAFRGVLADASTKTLRDTIDLVRGCKGSAGREAESVVLVGDGVASRSLPVILCGEDDVAGDHGATVGEVGPDQLAYLAARGLAADDAHALLMESTFAAALAQAPEGCARDAAAAAARRVLGREVA